MEQQQSLTKEFIKPGQKFMLLPYKEHYMLVMDSQLNSVQYHLVNLNRGVMTITRPTVQAMLDFLNKFKAITI